MIGKRVHDEIYIHLTVVAELGDPELEDRVRQAMQHISANSDWRPNVAKVNVRTRHISLLAYPDFEESPFPTLAASWRFAPGALAAPTCRTYTESVNPPILHRKEQLVGTSHPKHSEWSRLTSAAEAIGLFSETRSIGFRQNWDRLVASSGFTLDGHEFKPIGNDLDATSSMDALAPAGVQRHLTALSRGVLSAPIQLLFRNGLLAADDTLFDYGCGRGDDLAALRARGFRADGWDPHFAPDEPIHRADVVNLGFVVNVIEDAAERVDTLHRAFALARRVMSLGVMLNGSEAAGKPFRDGYLTTKGTFQKYFSQAELKDWIEHVLHREAFMVGPGVAVVFANQEAEQRFSVQRYRKADVATRLLATRRLSTAPAAPASRRHLKEPIQRQSRLERLAKAREYQRQLLDPLWRIALDLGRFPERDEVECLAYIEAHFGSLRQALRLLARVERAELLASAANARSDDIRLFMAMQLFGKRPPYRELESRLRRDIKSFFGDYGRAQEAGLVLLHSAADADELRRSCHEAARMGLGWLDEDHSLQFHVSLVDRLPVVLRAYVACGQLLWNATSETQLVKIHIGTGKLTLLEFENFDSSPIPLLKRRIKVNVRRLDYDVFEYGSTQFPKMPLYRKSRYLNEDCPGYAEQLAFDESLDRTCVVSESGFGPSLEALVHALAGRRLAIDGMTLCPSKSIPDLDQACGANFTFRTFVQCGETQARLGIANVPLRAETYNALYELAVNVLDPIVEYFGAIRVTYGFASADLTRQIRSRIAPRLDQHAGCEHNRRGVAVCSRGGAACDFIVDDENMREVADWLIAQTPFDRLYYYGPDRPVHVSWSAAPSRQAFEMRASTRGHLTPQPFRQTVRR
jgi:DNA phosphorothioation-associated putative methyltransferase